MLATACLVHHLQFQKVTSLHFTLLNYPACAMQAKAMALVLVYAEVSGLRDA
jgi:hypothetical protein